MRIEEIVSFTQTDEDEFELLCLVTSSGGVHRRLTMNTHTAAKLHDLIVKEMGEYIFERDSARATLPPEPPDDKGPWPGESALDYYKRSGDAEPMRAAADAINKAMKESG